MTSMKDAPEGTAAMREAVMGNLEPAARILYGGSTHAPKPAAAQRAPAGSMAERMYGQAAPAETSLSEAEKKLHRLFERQAMHDYARLPPVRRG